MRTRSWRAARLMLMLTCCLSVSAQTTRLPVRLDDAKEFEAFLAPLFAEQIKQLHIPGAAIAIVKDGRIFFAQGYGYARLETKAPVIADQTIFRIGSITKVFTATALVQLAERRKINLQDDVNQYLTAFKIPNTYPQPITFAHLLTHTAGFDEINLGRKTTSADKVIPLGEFLKTRLIRRKPPGEYISYSTYGISLAGYLVEAISQTGFRDYLAQNIFQPLGMKRTSVATVPAPLQADLAMGYESAGNNFRPLGFEYFHTYPASDINSTATDMARFMLALLADGRYESERILSERAARELRQPHFTNHPRLTGMAYGFQENRQHNLRAIEHGGSMDGFSALLYLAPEQRLGIFIACNREEDDLQEEVKSRILKRYFPVSAKANVPPTPTPSPERLTRFAGKYRADIYCHTCPEGARGYLPEAFDIKANDDGTLSFWDRKWRQVEPLLFQMEGQSTRYGMVQVAFRADASGSITHMFNGIWTQEKLGVKAAPATINLAPQVLNAYVGQYELGAIQLVIIRLEGNRLMGQMTGQPEVELFATSATRFVIKDADAEVNFSKDEQGRITHLVLRLGSEEMRGRKIK